MPSVLDYKSTVNVDFATLRNKFICKQNRIGIHYRNMCRPHEQKKKKKM